jgi:excisionase family DNA binding protein
MASDLAAPVKRWATIAEAAAYSGLSDKTLRRLIARRELVAHRPVPGRILVDLRALDAIIRSSAGAAGTRGCALHGDE